MTKWLKPDDLPKGFWKECFIAWTQHGQTAGLVWHDRYKMLLDCQRSYIPLDDI